VFISFGALFSDECLVSSVRLEIYLPELFYLCKSSIDLVAHGGDNIVDGYPALFVNESLTPDLGVDLITGLQVLANCVLILGDST